MVFFREVISDVFYASSKVRSYYSPPMDVDALTEAALKVHHTYFHVVFRNVYLQNIDVQSTKWMNRCFLIHTFMIFYTWYLAVE